MTAAEQAAMMAANGMSDAEIIAALGAEGVTMTAQTDDRTGAAGAPVQRPVRRDFGPLRFSVRRVADGAHVFAVPHQSAVSWFADLHGNGRKYFNDRSPDTSAHGLYVEWPSGPPRRVIGWDHDDGWPVVSDGPRHPAVRA